MESWRIIRQRESDKKLNRDKISYLSALPGSCTDAASIFQFVHVALIEWKPIQIRRRIGKVGCEPPPRPSYSSTLVAARDGNAALAALAVTVHC